MLKKSDLSKQFELVVKQEIKNYQDSHNAVLQAIRDLKENISVVEFYSKEAFAKLECRQSKILLEISELSKSMKALESKCDRRLNDLEKFRVDAINEIGIQIDISLKNAKINELNEIRINEIKMVLEDVDDDIKRYPVMISNFFDAIQSKLSKDLKRMKEEILSLPSEADKIRDEYDEKIDCHKIDTEGILKEIRVSRKDMIVIQKQIENIYTLIERLKKKENDFVTS